MTTESFAPGAVWGAVAEGAAARASEWVARLRSRGPGAAGFLRSMRRDPEGFEFTRRLLDLVGGTEDVFASALGLREMAFDVPQTMPAADRLAVRAGGATSLGMPWAVVPMARRRLRERVADLVLAAKLPTAGSGGASVARLNRVSEAMRGLSQSGLVPVLVPLGEAVHGPEASAAEAARLARLAMLPTVRHLVVDPARLAPGGSDWSAAADIDRAVRALSPVLQAAAEHGTTVHLEPRSVRWARLLPDLLVAAFADPRFDRVRVGVRLMAELPESREHYDRVYRWAQRRAAEGGAAVEAVIGVAGVAAAERIASIGSGLAVPVLEDAVEVHAQLLRLVELALHPGRAAALRPVIASEDLFVLAGTVALAERLGSRDLYAVQVRSGIAPGLAEELVRALAGSGAEVRVSLPVVAPREFSGAVDMLVGFAAEAADTNSVIARFDALLDATAVSPEAAFEAEQQVFARAAQLAALPAPSSHRTQVRAREWDPSERDSALFYRAPDEPSRFDTGGLTAAVLGLNRGSTGEVRLEMLAPLRAIPVVSQSGFANEPDTDASVPANREWVRTLLAEGRESGAATAGDAEPDSGALGARYDEADPAALWSPEARAARRQWRGQPPRSRASRLRRAALATVAARDRLLQCLAAETGAPLPELDSEVSDIVDAARYSGQLAEGLAAVRGASFVSAELAIIVAEADTSLSVQAEAVLSVLAAGSAAIWVAPRRLLGAANVLLEEWQVSGVLPGAVRVVASDPRVSPADLVAAPEIDRAIVLGDRAVAAQIAHRRPDLQVEGRLHARGTVLVAPSAEFDVAIADLVASAFREAGTDERGVRVAILLGSVARSRRFIDRLADAVRALRVGDVSHPGEDDPLAFEVGPLPTPPSEAQLRALTELERGEQWLVQPRQLDSEGRLWTPGVRLGVTRASRFWQDSPRVPVLGIAHAHTLDEALRLQNAPGSGAVAALQSNDAGEVLAWCERIEAASVVLNRPTTGARIERHPGGGWNDATMGLPALSGGPNRLLPLGAWQLREGTRSETLHLRGLDPEVQLLIEEAQSTLHYEEFDQVRRAALADALVWRTSFGAVRDTIGLGIERNAVRYLPVSTHLRLAEGGQIADLIRVLAAALLVRAPIAVSTGEVLPPGITAFLERRDIDVSLERDDDWVERLAVAGPSAADGSAAARVRLIGGDRVRAAEWLGGLDRTALWAQPVTMAGPVELLTLLREQAITARAHRHALAVPVPGLDELIEP